MYTRYYARSCAMRGVLVRVRLVLLRSSGGHIVILFAVMSAVFRCNATHCCIPFCDVVSMHAYAIRIPLDAYLAHAYCDSYTSTKQ